MRKQISDNEVADPEGLMRQYKKTGSVELRNQLVLHYSKYVNVAIYSMRSILLSDIPIEDFFNEGILALINCIERFDPDRGIKFNTFFFTNIRGALINYMRKQKWLPNQAREFRKKIKNGDDYLTQALGRRPSQKELAEYLGISEKKLSQYQYQISMVETVSFEELMEQKYGSEVDKLYSVQSSETGEDDIEKNLLDEELRHVLADAIDRLSPKEKQVITLCYYENLNLREMGLVLNLTQQRISQIRTAALEKLQAVLKDYMS